jgi:hypothetical protein
MKPTSQISPSQRGSPRDNRAPCTHQSFPLTDYSFQAGADAKSNSRAVLPATKPPAFHKIGSGFFGAETNRGYVAELLLFILIAGILAWPITSAIVAVTRLVRNY